MTVYKSEREIVSVSENEKKNRDWQMACKIFSYCLVGDSLISRKYCAICSCVHWHLSSIGKISKCNRQPSAIYDNKFIYTLILWIPFSFHFENFIQKDFTQFPEVKTYFCQINSTLSSSYFLSFSYLLSSKCTFEELKILCERWRIWKKCVFG